MALAADLNARLTQVGPDTPGGALLRRYWHPICPAAEVTAEHPTKAARLLGEDLVVYRTLGGRYGLVPAHCPHRRASLEYGFVEENGIRCAYHGWKFDVSGECVEMPFEPHPEKIQKLACRPAYVVEALSGLLWAYMGPAPAPLLPRWELLVSKNGKRDITVLPVHECNYLQAQENSCDPVHVYYLHAETLRRQPAEVQAKYTASIAYFGRPIEDYDFEIVHQPAYSGIRKIRTFSGENAERETGHPAIFPTMLVAPQGVGLTMHFRVPMDDTHMRIFWVGFVPDPDGRTIDQADEDIPVEYVPHPMQANGKYDLTSFIHHDLMAWETQGALVDRSQELLGASDRGVTMWRKMLREQIDIVEAGGEPAGIIRDPSINRVISLGITDRVADTSLELVESAR
jgi:5,5'-dehydrodivanillate O-demethylase oxygenase subunit